MNEEEINKIKSDAVMNFVNRWIGAYETGFVVNDKISLATLYRTAQIQIKDDYGINISNIGEMWGERLAGELTDKQNKAT